MKQQLLITIAAVVLVGCGTTQPPEPPTAKAPDISIHEAVAIENTEAVKQHLDASTDVNAKVGVGKTPLHNAIRLGNTEIAELLIAEEPIYRKPFALYENCNCIATRDNCFQTISKCSIARKNIDASH
jgi:hypothetical protein